MLHFVFGLLEEEYLESYNETVDIQESLPVRRAIVKQSTYHERLAHLSKHISNARIRNYI